MFKSEVISMGQWLVEIKKLVHLTEIAAGNFVFHIMHQLRHTVVLSLG
jgi:hypothetical protein